MVIIEDDLFFAEALKALIVGLGYEVVVRLDSSASETFEIGDTDIVFLDLLMPHVTGLQVLEQLNKQQVKSSIVLISGNDHFLREAEQAISRLDLRLLGVLYKPFRLDDVTEMMKGI